MRRGGGWGTPGMLRALRRRGVLAAGASASDSVGTARGGPAGPALLRRERKAEASLSHELRRWWPTPGGPEEAALHQFAVSRRSTLFPGHPWVYEHEWEAGNRGVSFRGDLLLFDGNESFLSVEAKMLPEAPGPGAPPEALNGWEELCGARVRQVERQAAVGEVLALHFLAQEARAAAGVPESGSFVYRGPLPSVASAAVTSAFRAEHHPHLAEAELRELREAWADFRARLQVVKKRQRWRLREPPQGE